jgi:hypothetical protein
MTHTAVGLFPNSIDAEKAVADLKAAGFSAGDVRVAAEPRYMPVSSPLSTPGMDFCEELSLNLRAMGLTEAETQAYIQGVRNGGALVFANGSIEQVEIAAGVMNRNRAATEEQLNGLEPVLAEVLHDSAIPREVDSAQVGRVRSAGSGARMFAW